MTFFFKALVFRLVLTNRSQFLATKTNGFWVCSKVVMRSAFNRKIAGAIPAIGYFFSIPLSASGKKVLPVGLEPTTTRLKAGRST